MFFVVTAYGLSLLLRPMLVLCLDYAELRIPRISDWIGIRLSVSKIDVSRKPLTYRAHWIQQPCVLFWCLTLAVRELHRAPIANALVL